MITSAVAIRGALASLEQLRTVAVHLFTAKGRQDRLQPAHRGAVAEQLRTFALDFAKSDPDFAAELRTAADRHEHAC